MSLSAIISVLDDLNSFVRNRVTAKPNGFKSLFAMKTNIPNDISGFILLNAVFFVLVMQL